MSIRTIFLAIVIILSTVYISANWEKTLSYDSEYCDIYFNIISGPDYNIGYGDRINAVINGCI